LRRSNERFELVTRATNDIVWDWDLRTDTLWWSENMGSTFGYDRLDLERGMESWYEPIHLDDYERVVGGIHEVIDSDSVSWQDEYRFRHNDGRYLAIFDRAFVIRDKSGKAIRMIGAMMDITARKKSEIENRQHAMQQSLLAEFGQKALASTNLDTIMDEAAVVVAKGLEVEFCRAMQLSPDGTSLIFKAGCGWNDRWLRRSVPINDPDVRKRYELHLNVNGPIVVDDFSTETRFVPSATLTEHQIASAVEVIIRGPSGIYGMVGAYSRERSAFSAEKVNFLRSISITLGTAVERVRSDERVAYLAQFDTLTGLPNRHLFHDRMAQTLSQAERNNWYAGVVYIDVDRFKIVNDTYGHAIGDALLTEVAQRLSNCVRSGDTVGRLGGDEFAIVLSDLANVYDANTVAQKILDALAQPFKLDAYETYVTASLGISLYPSDGIDADILLKNADTAMYRAKEQGRNNFEFYTEVLNQRATHRISIERELRHAIERHQLELFYQPQISLETGQIVAAEALIRWRNPQRGLLGPSEFIGIAEESGLIVPIGQWVVETACTQTMLWHLAGHAELTIAVNVSPAEIRRGNVPDQIRAALHRSGLKPQNFEVEITESMAMDSAESFIDTLRTLKNVGVMIAIDDFGTGYSNLSYLKRFPIDTIKIDQTFIRDIVTDTDDAVIVRAIIAMAHQLKLDVVAEGVETEAQAAFLRRNQIDLVQGFLFSPALDATAFGQLLDRRKSVFSERAVTGVLANGLFLITADRELQQDFHLLAQRQRRDDFGIRAVFQDIHQQLFRIAVRQFQFVTAILEHLSLLLRMPVFIGHPARRVRRKTDRRPRLGLAGKNSVAVGQVRIEFSRITILRRHIENLRVIDTIQREAAQRVATVIPRIQIPVVAIVCEALWRYLALGRLRRRTCAITETQTLAPQHRASDIAKHRFVDLARLARDHTNAFQRQRGAVAVIRHQPLDARAQRRQRAGENARAGATDQFLQRDQRR